MLRKLPGSEKRIIALCLLLILFILAGLPLLGIYVHSSSSEERTETAGAQALEGISDQLSENLVFTDTTAPSAVSFFESGQVFPDSSEEALTEEEIHSLRDIASTSWQYRILIRLAINEIYARKGLHFSESGPFWSFYSGFDWYEAADGIGDGDLTSLERDNVSLLTRIEREEREASGYYLDGVELVPLQGSYEQARRYATCLGGSLVKITDASVQDSVQKLMESAPSSLSAWTAGYFQEGRWRWDETTAVEYDAWAEGEPAESANGARLQVLPEGSWAVQADAQNQALILIKYNR